MELFKNTELHKETEKAFMNWVESWGATPHKLDEARFNLFALEYCRNNDSITKPEFVNGVKIYTNTTKTENRGIAQEYYRRLNAIKSFWMDNKLK